MSTGGGGCWGSVSALGLVLSLCAVSKSAKSAWFSPLRTAPGGFGHFFSKWGGPEVDCARAWLRGRLPAWPGSAVPTSTA